MSLVARNTPNIAQRRELFCRTYAATWDIAEAAKACNYAMNHAIKLLHAPEIIHRIAVLNARNLKAADITAQRVLLELARVGFSDIRKIVDADGRLKQLIDLDDDTAASISGIEVEQRMESELVEDLATGEMVKRMSPVITTKIKKSDKVAALNILAKHFKLVGDEGDGVNALASALADRLQSARRRVVNSQEIEDARIIDNDPAHVLQRGGEGVSQPRDGDRADPEGLRNDGSAALAVRE